MGIVTLLFMIIGVLYLLFALRCLSFLPWILPHKKSKFILFYFAFHLVSCFGFYILCSPVVFWEAYSKVGVWVVLGLIAVFLVVDAILLSFVWSGKIRKQVRSVDTAMLSRNIFSFAIASAMILFSHWVLAIFPVVGGICLIYIMNKYGN